MRREAETRARFVDLSGAAAKSPELWPALVVRAREIEDWVERLAAAPRPPNGRRSAVIAHPCATEPGLGLAPGIRVRLEVLLPGERSAPLRHNATELHFSIRGRGGHCVVNGRRIDARLYDVWNVPSWVVHWHDNDGPDLWVRLAYSNAALLEKLAVYIVDESPPQSEPARAVHGELADDPRRRSPYGSFALGDGGSWLMPYEILINPPAVVSPALHWSWLEVRAHLDKLQALGADYVGRRLYLLYNPMTGRTNGTTPSFFATMTVRPPNIVDRPHRHTSAAINYYFAGYGHSTVEGRVHEWRAGDLMLSAPGWGVHNHASRDEPVYELTVQDQPLQIAMESLLWQEDLSAPAALLGVEPGFATNRGGVDAAVDRWSGEGGR